jgi:hypothetical protein
VGNRAREEGHTALLGAQRLRLGRPAKRLPWRIPSGRALLRSRSVRLCYKNARFVSSGQGRDPACPRLIAADNEPLARDRSCALKPFDPALGRLLVRHLRWHRFGADQHQSHRGMLNPPKEFRLYARLSIVDPFRLALRFIAIIAE